MDHSIYDKQYFVYLIILGQQILKNYLDYFVIKNLRLLKKLDLLNKKINYYLKNNVISDKKFLRL